MPALESGPNGLQADTRRYMVRTWLVDLLADAFEYSSGDTGHRSVGQSIQQWWRDNRLNPLNLHLAWVARCRRHRCLEVELVRELSPTLNKKASARCSVHG